MTGWGRACGGASAALAAALWLVVGLSAQSKHGNPEAAKLQNPIAASPAAVAAGEAVYMKYCRGCHAKDAAGGPPPEAGEEPASNLIDAEWNHGSSDGEIFHVIKNGVPPAMIMEAFGTRVPDSDIWNVVHFLRSIAKK